MTKQTFVKLATAAKGIAWILPQNLEKIEAKLNKVKPPKWGQTFTDQRDTKRQFPQYKAGMSTGEYISRFNSLNNKLGLSLVHDLLKYDENPAAEYDATTPLCVIDENPDYNEASELEVAALRKLAEFKPRARRDIKGERIAALEALLLQALPFVEVLTEDNSPNQVKALAFRAKIRAALNLNK